MAWISKCASIPYYWNGEDIDEYVLRNNFVTEKKRKIENDVFPESFERNDETTPGI